MNHYLVLLSFSSTSLKQLLRDLEQLHDIDTEGGACAIFQDDIGLVHGLKDPQINVSKIVGTLQAGRTT